MHNTLSTVKWNYEGPRQKNNGWKQVVGHASKLLDMDWSLHVELQQNI